MRYILISLYFSSLVSFSLFSNPLVYCGLLLVGALSLSGFAYLVLGFSWYLVLFCLVYVGGIYILFLYVSVHNPNSFPSLGGGVMYFSVFCFFFLVFYAGSRYLGGLEDFSHYVCTSGEGVTYNVFCLVLMLSFVLVSLVGSGKDSFFR
uniref:NADH dehydrogenase subunit 6 n=1 Tax=Tanaisia sp. SS-2020 TaxID=2780549 RepID=A0A894JQM9_9TREM|nr:NADH dehydrogenase subunit 6 [Tanaisia sp. SS-2020]